MQEDDNHKSQDNGDLWRGRDGVTLETSVIVIPLSHTGWCGHIASFYHCAL